MVNYKYNNINNDDDESNIIRESTENKNIYGGSIILISENNNKQIETTKSKKQRAWKIFRKDDPLFREKLGLLFFSLIFNMDLITFPFEPIMYQRYVQHTHPSYTTSEIDSLASHYKSIGDALPFVGAFISGPIIGMISDRIGRKPVIYALIGFILLNQLSMILSYEIYELYPLYITKFISGFSNNMGAITNAMVADITTKEERSSYCAFLGITMGFSIIFAPIGGILLINWHTISAVIVSFSLNLFGVVIMLFLRETIYYCDSIPITKEERVSISQQIPSSTSSESTPSTTTKKSSKNPLKAIYYLFKSSMYIGFYAILYFMYSYSIEDSSATGYLYVNVRYGAGTTLMGILSSLMGVMVIVWSIVCNYLLGRGKSSGSSDENTNDDGENRNKGAISDRRMVSVAFLVTAIIHILYALSFNGYMYGIVSCIGAFSLILSSIIQSIISKATPGDMQAFVQSAIISISSVASFVGALVSENVFAYFISNRAPFYFPGMHFMIDGCILFITFLFSLYVIRKFPIGCSDERCQQQQQPLINDNNNNDNNINYEIDESSVLLNK